MHILVTNDDGIRAPGLRALAEAAAALGRVTVVAPETEQSAVGHSISLHQPLVARPLPETGTMTGWAVEGSPADCVKLAILELLDEKPDLVLAGINLGSNLGINVLYSGTVAAAIEAAFYGVRAMAFSLEWCPEPDFGDAATRCRQIAEDALVHDLPAGSLLNVNLPRTDGPQPRGVRVVPQGLSGFGEHYERRQDPRGRTYFWISGGQTAIPHDGQTDMSMLAQSYVTVTPLRFDLTDPKSIEPVSRWQWSLEDSEG